MYFPWKLNQRYNIVQRENKTILQDSIILSDTKKTNEKLKFAETWYKSDTEYVMRWLWKVFAHYAYLINSN